MTYALALDLTNDPAHWADYDRYHTAVWPEIEAGIRAAGITGMTIYRLENRLFMLMDTDETFSFEQKAQMDAENDTVQAWETLMATYQQAIPGGHPGEKWRLLQPVYRLGGG